MTRRDVALKVVELAVVAGVAVLTMYVVRRAFIVPADAPRPAVEAPAPAVRTGRAMRDGPPPTDVRPGRDESGEPQPDPAHWDRPVYRVDVFLQNDQETPVQRLGYYDRKSLEVGFRQIALYWAPHRGDTPAGVTVFDTVRDVWVDPVTDEPLDGVAHTWLDTEVKVGNGRY